MPGIFRSMIHSGLSRVVALLSSIICTTVTSRIMFSEFGPEVFGLAVLIGTTQQLIPFADLGMGAAVMNRVARANAENRLADAFPLIHRVVRILGILSVFAVTLTLLVLTASQSGTSHTSPQLNAAVMAACVILMSIPLGVGNRVLIGLNGTHSSVLISAMGPPVTLLVTLVIATNDVLPNSLSVFAWPVGAYAVGVATSIYALHRLRISIRTAVRALFRRSRPDLGDEAIWRTSVPMLVISICSPLAFAADRWIIANIVGLQGAARYSVAAQIYAPLLSILTTAATPLWTHFAVRGHDRRSLAMSMGALSVVSVLAAAIMALAMPIYSSVVTGDSEYVSTALVAAFSLLLVVNGFALPHMMSLNTGSRLRIQAMLIGISSLINFPLSVLAAKIWGVPGPVWVSCACLSVLQLAPMLFINLRRSPPRVSYSAGSQA